MGSELSNADLIIKKQARLKGQRPSSPDMTLKMGIISICIILLILGCASFPNPNDENKSLVIGEIVQRGSGYKYYGPVSVNGTNRAGIEIVIQDIISGQTYNMRTRNGGIFYSTNIPEGVYKITQLYFKKESGSSWASITWTTPDNAEHKFEVTDDKVNNFGVIRWECESGIGNRIFYNQEYGQVRDSFQEKNKSSNWNEKDWISINVKRENL